MKKLFVATLLLAGAGLPAAAMAQAAPASDAAAAASTSANLAVGAKVYGPQGEEVGTIESVAGDAVVVNTGAARATLARSSFGTGANGPTIGLGKTQLEAAVQQAQAQTAQATETAIVPGAEVRSKDGQPVGKIASVTGEQVVLDRPGGAVTLTKANLTSGAQGLSLVMTAAEFEAAAKAATSASADSKPGKTG